MWIFCSCIPIRCRERKRIVKLNFIVGYSKLYGKKKKNYSEMHACIKELLTQFPIKTKCGFCLFKIMFINNIKLITQ